VKKLPEAEVYEESLSVETMGNLAFSKPLILRLRPEELIIFGTRLMEDRYNYTWID